jgi:DEAD/DEAH box helicase domain-containing protein
LADRLENGAGYAPELSQPAKLKEVLEGILGELTNKYEAPAHAECTEACPDCLRSWDNRPLHGALDWRLGLDVAALAAGHSLPTERWLNRGRVLTERFTRAFSGALPCHVENLADLHAIVRDDLRVAVVLGHPLWIHDERFLNIQQAEAYETVRSELNVDRVVMSDLWVLDRIPAQIYELLRGSD